MAVPGTTGQTTSEPLKKPVGRPSIHKTVYVCLGFFGVQDCDMVYSKSEEHEAMDHLQDTSHEMMRIEVTGSSIKPSIIVSKEVKVLGMLKREIQGDVPEWKGAREVVEWKEVKEEKRL